MAEKVTFDGPNKIIQVNFGETELSAERDVYSAWKRWVVTPPSASQVPFNSGYFDALRTVGGDPIGAGQEISPYFFLINGWRMRSWEGDHFLRVLGNLYVDEADGGGSPIVPTQGNYQIVGGIEPQDDTTSTFGYTIEGTQNSHIENRIVGVWGEATDGNGTADYIMAFLKALNCKGNYIGNATAGLYEYVDNNDNFAGALLGQTEIKEITIQEGEIAWIKFDFTGIKPSIINNTKYISLRS